MNLLLWAQASPVGSGRLVGGWEFITASYVLTCLGIVLYGLSLWMRRRKE